jgi:hypothetical protein
MADWTPSEARVSASLGKIEKQIELVTPRRIELPPPG